MRQIIMLEDFMPAFDIGKMAASMRPDDAPGRKELLERMAAEAATVARPRGVAIMAGVKPANGDDIEIGSVVFTSALLCEKLNRLNRVFPYLVTEGVEMAEWAKQFTDAEDIACSRAIRQAVVKGCEARLEEEIGSRYDIPVLSTMNPGSLAAWPITQQEKMFELLDPLPLDIGVRLLPSMWLDPGFSVAGIFFQTDKKYYNCQLCPRDDCPNRKAPREKAD